MPSSHDVTALLVDWSHGNAAARDRLMPLVYAELRRIARRSLAAVRPEDTLQPTALVHEAYLKLVDQRQVNWHDRAHFFGVAAQLMRRILVDHARRHQAGKRGGGVRPLALEQAGEDAPASELSVVAVDQLLTRLGEIDPQQAEIVELRAFGGLTIEEAADVLGVSPSTVKRDWRMGRAWLYQELRREKRA